MTTIYLLRIFRMLLSSRMGKLIKNLSNRNSIYFKHLIKTMETIIISATSHPLTTSWTRPSNTKAVPATPRSTRIQPLTKATTARVLPVTSQCLEWHRRPQASIFLIISKISAYNNIRDLIPKTPKWIKASLLLAISHLYFNWMPKNPTINLT